MVLGCICILSVQKKIVLDCKRITASGWHDEQSKKNSFCLSCMDSRYLRPNGSLNKYYLPSPAPAKANIEDLLCLQWKRYVAFSSLLFGSQLQKQCVPKYLAIYMHVNIMHGSYMVLSPWLVKVCQSFSVVSFPAFFQFALHLFHHGKEGAMRYCVVRAAVKMLGRART